MYKVLLEVLTMVGVSGNYRYLAEIRHAETVSLTIVVEYQFLLVQGHLFVPVVYCFIVGRSCYY